MGWFDDRINDFRRKKDDLVNSRFNVVNQARSAIALAKPTFQQGMQRVSTQVRQNPSQFFYPTSQSFQQPIKQTVQKVPTPVRQYVRSIPQRASQPNILGPFGQLTGIGQSYTQNRITQPLQSATRDVRQAVAPSTPNWKRPVKLGAAGLNVAGAAFSAIPSPWLAGFLGYDYMKGQRAGQLRGENFLQSQVSGVKSVTGSKPIGLGEALTTDPKGQMIGNIAELPLMIGITHKLSGKPIPKQDLEKVGRTLIAHLRPNAYENLSTENRLRYSNNLEELASKYIPQIFKNKEVQKLAGTDPDKYRRTLANFLHDKVNQPKLNLGFGTRDINKNLPVKGQPLQKSPTGDLKQKISQEASLKTQIPISPKVVSSTKSISPVVNQTPYFNSKRLNISPEAQKAVDKVVADSKVQIEAITGGKLSNQEIVDFANNSAKVLRRAIPQEQTKAWEAAMLKTRQTLAAQAQDGALTKDFLDNLLVVKTQSTDIARKLQSLGIDADPQMVTAKQAILQAVLDAGTNADEILTASKGVNFNDIKQATQFYRQFIAPKASEWIDLLRYNSMLSSPNTHIINTASNIQGASLVAPIEKASLGVLDFLSSTVTGKQRRYYVGESGAYLRGFLSNIKQASHNFADVMTGKALNKNPDIRNIPLTTKGFKRGVENILSLPLRFLEAEDQFIQTLARAGETQGLLYRQAKGTPVKNLEVQASLKAAGRLFRGELNPEGQGHLLNAIDSVTNVLFQLRNNSNPIVSTIAKFTIPFIKTPMNILKQGVEYSPTGLATLPGSANKMEQLNKALLGSMAGMGTAILLGSNRLTWAKPSDSKNAQAFDNAGLQPYSVKIGDKWISYAKLHPAIAFNFAIVAATKDALDRRKITDSDATVIMTSLAQSMQFFADQSYVKNIGDFIASTKGDLSGPARYLANYPSQLIPFRALASWANRLVDPYQRKVDPTGDILTKQMQYIAMQIPGFSQQLPVKRGPEGESLKQQNRLINAFSPARIANENEQNKKVFLYGTNALRSYKELKKLDREQANKYLGVIKNNSPQLYSDIQKLMRQEKLGITAKDAKIGNLGVENGNRAYAIASEIKKLKTSEEKNEYIKKLREAKILTKDVEKQLIELRKRGEL